MIDFSLKHAFLCQIKHLIIRNKIASQGQDNKCSTNNLHPSLCMKSIREKQYKHLTIYIYVLFPQFKNNPPAGKEKDCHHQETVDSKIIKNVIDGGRSLTTYLKTIYLKTIKLIFHKFRNLNKTQQVSQFSSSTNLIIKERK